MLQSWGDAAVYMQPDVSSIMELVSDCVATNVIIEYNFIIGGDLVWTGT